MRQKWLLFCIGVVAVIGSGGFQPLCATTPVQRPAGTNGEQVKTLVRRWIEQGFNRRDLTVVDELFVSEVMVNGQRVSRPVVKQSMSRFITAFPDLAGDDHGRGSQARQGRHLGFGARDADR